MPSLPVAPIESLVITNASRLTDAYPLEAAGVQTKLTALGTATNGVVLPVDHYDGDPGEVDANGDPINVVAAYAAQDADPSNPDLANDVVREINRAVDAFLGARRGELKNITLVGTDEMVPMAHVPDLTQVANERSFLQDLRNTGTNSGGNNALMGAARASRILSDDPYGSFTPRPFGGTFIYAPDVAIGRLVESPSQINGTIDQFLTPETGDPVGTLHPTSTLSAGHDFMTQLSEDVAEAFSLQLPGATNDTLISESWTKPQILNAIGNGAAPTPDIISINAHYSPNFFAPADKSLGNVSAAEAATAAEMAKRLFVTMGCHSGYNIADYLAGSDPQDFASMLAGEPVSAFVANTGFGLGLRDVTAFSQKLFQDFAQNLANGSLGKALLEAKQEYLADGVTNPYDYKVIAQAIFYGIPQYTIAGATPLPAPPPGPDPVADPESGLQAASITAQQPTAGDDPDDGEGWEREDTDDGSFWTLNDGEHAIVPNYPVQPTFQQEVTKPGLTAGGVMVTALTIGQDQAHFDPTLARAVVDNAERETEYQFGDILFPARLAEIRDFGGDNAGQRLQIVPAQFRSTGFNADGNLEGVERRFSNIGTQVFYRAANQLDPDQSAPVLSGAKAEQSGDATTFEVFVADAESEVTRVTVLYRRNLNSTFELVDLHQVGSSDLWRVTVPVSDTLDFLMQGVNVDALVGAISNRGFLFDEVVVPPQPGTEVVSVSTSPDPVSGNVYDEETDVTFTSSDDGSHLFISVDGGAEQDFFDQATIHLGEGVHTLTYRTEAPDGVTAAPPGEVNLIVDLSDPDATITTPDDSVPEFPLNQNVSADFACADALDVGDVRRHERRWPAGP